MLRKFQMILLLVCSQRCSFLFQTIIHESWVSLAVHHSNLTIFVCTFGVRHSRFAAATYKIGVIFTRGSTVALFTWPTIPNNVKWIYTRIYIYIFINIFSVWVWLCRAQCNAMISNRMVIYTLLEPTQFTQHPYTQREQRVMRETLAKKNTHKRSSLSN